MTAADEVWRLQRGSDADCRFFQRAVNGGELITDKGTRQGIWVMSAGGVLLSRINSRNADKVLETIERGWEAWLALPEDQRGLPAEAELEAVHRWELSVPGGGLILERFARDVGERPDEEPRRLWNRDFAWFTREEARAWLPDRPVIGDVHQVEEASVRRLARFHLTDNVRGQTLPFAEEEVVVAELETEVLSIDGARVALALRGKTKTAAKGPWLLGESLWKPRSDQPPHGVETEILGMAEYDLSAERFTELEVVAVGRRWGHTHVNGRRGNGEPGLIGFHLSLADGGPVIAPTFIVHYNADWVDFDGSEVANF